MTFELAATIRAQHAAGKRIADLAREHGLSWNMAKRIATGQSWVRPPRKRRKYSDAVVRNIVAFVDAGYSGSRVARLMGCSRGLVSLIATGKRHAAIVAAARAGAR